MRNTVDSPCIVCAFRPIIWVGRFLGFSPLSTQCSVNGRPCVFAPSWFWILISVCVAGIIFGTMIGIISEPDNLNLGLVIDTEESVIANVVTAIECLNHLTSIVLIALNTLQSKTTANALNSIAAFLASPAKYSTRSITENDERALFTVALRQILYLVAVMLLQNAFAVYFLNRHWETLPDREFIIWKSFVASISNAVFLINGFQFGIVTKLLRLMLYNVKDQLHVLIEMALARNNNINNSCDGNHSPNGGKIIQNRQPKICDEIAVVRLVYARVISCQHQFNHSVNPQLAIVTTLVMISIVLSSYLLLQYLLTGNEEILFLLTTGRLFVNIITALYMIHLSDTLFQMREFLYHYIVKQPTSMLHYHELTQLEMLMQQIDRSPPLFSASQIFPFSAGILANMFGAVITFVLVAIQFKMEATPPSN